jgi:hypothetical protein
MEEGIERETNTRSEEDWESVVLVFFDLFCGGKDKKGFEKRARAREWGKRGARYDYVTTCNGKQSIGF